MPKEIKKNITLDQKEKTPKVFDIFVALSKAVKEELEIVSKPEKKENNSQKIKSKEEL